MPKLTPLKAPKDPEEYLRMAAWALKNRDRFDATTVMNLAEQAIGAYLADTAQRKSAADGERLLATCVQCGRETTDPAYVKIPLGTAGWAKQPYCPDCAAALECAAALTPKKPNPERGVRQG